MAQIDVGQFAQIPFVNPAELSGRALFSTLFFDGKWHAWIDAGGSLFPTEMQPAESIYFGTRPEQEADVYLHFLDIIGQRLSHLSVAPLFFGLQDDLLNLSASLAKIRFLHRTRKDYKHGASRMIATEVEYLHGVCRSIFDLWQEVVVKFWDSITLVDKSVKKRQLRKSYREMVFSDNKLRTVDELVTRFPGLPRQLAQCYVQSGAFFAELRKFRDRIIHQGAGVDIIFDGEEDFLIAEARVPFTDMHIWRKDDRQPNGLVPLTPALGYVIYRTLEACNIFSQTIEMHFKLPPPAVPSFRIFLRAISMRN